MRREIVQSSSGSASVEFAIIAPVLVFAVLATADIGFAIHQSLRIDQSLRNGAQAALHDPGRSRVEAVLAAVDGTDAAPATTWAVDRFCACPDTPASATACSTTCSGNKPTAIFYSIEGKRPYVGVVIPRRDVSRSASIQVR